MDGQTQTHRHVRTGTHAHRHTDIHTHTHTHGHTHTHTHMEHGRNKQYLVWPTSTLLRDSRSTNFFMCMKESEAT